MASSGERPPTDDTMKKLAAALGREGRRLHAAAATIDSLRAAIEQDLN